MSLNQSSWKNAVARFLTAQTISLFGSSLVQYAIVWYITLTTSSGLMLTLSTLCGFVPQIVISLFAGVWIDRYDRKKLIILSDSLIALSTLALAIAFFAGKGSVWLLLAVLMVRAAGTGVQSPAVNAMLPQLVPQEHLMRISGINSTLQSIMMLLSPAVSGAVLSVAPLEATLLIDVVTAVIGVGITVFIRVPPYQRSAEAPGSVLAEAGAGLRYLRENTFVRRLLLFQLVFFFLISNTAFMTPLLVSRTFGAEVWRLTAGEMTYSVGMVLGGLLLAVWGGRKQHMHTMLLAGMAYGVLMLGLGLSRVFWIYLVCNVLIGIASPFYNAPVTVSIQERVEPHMHGRVFSLLQIANSCALPLGMVLFGPLADLVRVQTLMLIAGVLVVALSAAMYLTRALEA